MKKSLAIFCLLLVAAFCSLQPTAKTRAYSNPSTRLLKLRAPAKAATSMGASAEALRSLAIRRDDLCPVGYYNCNGCCVPYECGSSTQDGVQ